MLFLSNTARTHAYFAFFRSDKGMVYDSVQRVLHICMQAVLSVCKMRKDGWLCMHVERGTGADCFICKHEY